MQEQDDNDKNINISLSEPYHAFSNIMLLEGTFTKYISKLKPNKPKDQSKLKLHH